MQKELGKVRILIMRRGVSTCFDHNSSKSRNFWAIEVVPNRSRGDLSFGATNTFPLGEFDMKISRESHPLHKALAPQVKAVSAHLCEANPHLP